MSNREQGRAYEAGAKGATFEKREGEGVVLPKKEGRRKEEEEGKRKRRTRKRGDAENSQSVTFFFFFFFLSISSSMRQDPALSISGGQKVPLHTQSAPQFTRQRNLEAKMQLKCMKTP